MRKSKYDTAPPKSVFEELQYAAMGILADSGSTEMIRKIRDLKNEGRNFMWIYGIFGTKDQIALQGFVSLDCKMELRARLAEKQ